VYDFEQLLAINDMCVSLGHPKAYPSVEVLPEPLVKESFGFGWQDDELLSTGEYARHMAGEYHCGGGYLYGSLSLPLGLGLRCLYQTLYRYVPR
jgi:hypothetical protein